MNKEELLKIVKDTIKECNGDTTKAITKLEKKCDQDFEIMQAFAKHGADVTNALIESTNQIKH